MLHRYLIAEFLKLRHSLALLLCVAAPSCVVVLLTIVWLGADNPGQAGDIGLNAASLWGFAMVPLTITALGVLLAQMEHGPRSWLHLLTLRGARPNLYLAKALTMLALIAAMSVLLWIEALLGAAFVRWLRPNVTGELFPAALALLLAMIAAAATLAAMLQLWVALYFRSFVPPLVLGIAGTFVAFVLSNREEGVYFPWLMPAKVMSEPALQQSALLLGSVGGLVAMAAMVLHLNRREV